MTVFVASFLIPTRFALMPVFSYPRGRRRLGLDGEISIRAMKNGDPVWAIGEIDKDVSR